MGSTSENLESLRQSAIVATLRQSRIFGGLPPLEIAQVADCCVVKSLEKDETLFHEGILAQGFYIIQTGAIKVYRLTPDGKEQIIHVFRALESFGEIVLSTQENYPANAIALERTQVILVSKTGFLALLHEKPKLSLLMLASMSLHLKHLVTSLQDIKGRQIEGRLARWILQQKIEDMDVAPFVQLGLSKKVLAGQMGVTSETLSRTLARFRDEGIVQVKREFVYLTSIEKLRAYAEGTI